MSRKPRKPRKVVVDKVLKLPTLPAVEFERDAYPKLDPAMKDICLLNLKSAN